MLRADGIKWLESEKESPDSGGFERASEGNKNKPRWLKLRVVGKKKSYDWRQKMNKRGGGGGLDLGKSRTRGR